MRTIFMALNKKNWWNSVHHEQSYKRSRWPTLSRQCVFGVCQCIWVRATWLWCRENFTFPSNFPQSNLGRRADSRWALPQIYRLFIFCYKFIVQRDISEMRRPIGAKFCIMVSTGHSFIMPIQNFLSLPPKKIRGQKHAKFSPISNNFEVRRRISPKRMKIFKTG